MLYLGVPARLHVSPMGLCVQAGKTSVHEEFRFDGMLGDKPQEES